MITKRTQQEIDDQLNWAAEKIDNGGSNYPGMSYEQGVDAALRWVIGETDDKPDGEE